MPPRFQLDEDDDQVHEAAVFVKAPEEAYAAVYSPFRQRLRQLVMQEVYREMPALISIQQKYRSPLLDHLFVLTGMLGNHAFFMLALPFLHVFGGGMFSRGLTFVVLWSIYFSGWVKDYISAPRPASPPIVQITRSPAHTFEYGFPSSHTTYVVATIIYITHFMLNEWSTPLSGVLAFWTVGTFIVVGRIYCGLHSFIDVIGGIVIGMIEALAMIAFYPQFDALLLTTPVLVVAWKLASKRPMIALVRRFAHDTPSSYDAIQSEKQSGDIADSRKEGGYRMPAPGSILAGHYGTHELMATCENIARIPIYSGIGVMVYVVAPVLFSLTGLMPV
ncbi:Long-chain base-1-phosphate phosphatase [Coemansia interrupta]|uniref:Long-chain base-1-phosphate phosphatase n=1 Tax=Coemansia interrupta TaxID=1126814 RepID=A0A9W8HIQ5_9FUNG|nr:Long-chain base-1-phosphate phosphatase [Coemansia interrupta]